MSPCSSSFPVASGTPASSRQPTFCNQRRPRSSGAPRAPPCQALSSLSAFLPASLCSPHVLISLLSYLPYVGRSVRPRPAGAAPAQGHNLSPGLKPLSCLPLQACAALLGSRFPGISQPPVWQALQEAVRSESQPSLPPGAPLLVVKRVHQ